MTISSPVIAITLNLLTSPAITLPMNFSEWIGGERDRYVKDDLAALQRAVSDHCEESFIEYTYPFEDDCMILGNEEAKLNGMEGNRRLGESIYAGPIFITRDDGIGGLCSLTDEQVIKYSEMFAKPHDISPEEVQSDCGFTFYGW